MKENNCNTDILPTAGLVYHFYTHVTATRQIKMLTGQTEEGGALICL